MAPAMSTCQYTPERCEARRCVEGCMDGRQCRYAMLQKAACRMVIPNTSIHAWVIQSESKKKKGSKNTANGSTAAGPGQEAPSPSTSTRQVSTKGKGPAAGVQTAQVEESHPAQRQVPQAMNSRVPIWDYGHMSGRRICPGLPRSMVTARGVLYATKVAMYCFVMRKGVGWCNMQSVRCRVTLKRDTGAATTAG